MKEPKVTKLPSGAYHTRLRLGGEDISITAATPEECRAEALQIKTEHKIGKRIAASKAAKNMTLLEAEEAYIKANRAVLSPSTTRGYEQYKNCRFKDYQKKALKDIDFQKMINDELEDVSEKTVKNCWGLVHASLKHVGYPIPAVKLAKVPVNEIAFLQPEEILPFCEAVKGKTYEIPALLLLHGLRLSEALALTWDKIDTKKQLITVKGAKVKGPDGWTDKKTNKNRTSTRVVPIMIPQLLSALKAAQGDSGPVVGISPSCLLRDVKRSCKRAGVTEVTNHGLRHSFASLGYHLGISERQLMAWGGWADFQTMHKIYIRLASSDESKAADAVRAFFKTTTETATDDEKASNS